MVDEIQDYTNIETRKCESLIGLCVDHRWGLSGTIIAEPTIDRLLGLYMILGDKTSPRNLPDMQTWVRSNTYPGIGNLMITRSNNDAFVPPKLIENIIQHSTSENEVKIYTSMRKIMNDINHQIKIAKQTHNVDATRVFGSYLLAMIGYLRQVILCPLLPVASAAIDIYNVTQIRSDLSKLIINELTKILPEGYLNDIDSAYSSRIREAIGTLEKHENERVVVFSCYRTGLNIFKSYIPSTRQQFCIGENMTSTARAAQVEAFSKSHNGVLLLTYQVGAQGLNLQSASTVVLLDLWWNASKTKQAITRVYRYGQKAEEVNVYLYTSNTGIEKAMLSKQMDKLNVIDEIQKGPMQSKIAKLHIREIVEMINEGDNTAQLERIMKK